MEVKEGLIYVLHIGERMRNAPFHVKLNQF